MRKNRRSRDNFIYGINPVFEALRAGKRRCREILISSGKNNPRFVEIRRLALDMGVPVVDAPAGEMRGLINGGVHQGVVAKVDSFPFSDVNAMYDVAAGVDGGGVIVALDGITDPQNFGAVIRTAYLLGVSGIIIPTDNSSAVTSTVVKASSGSTEYLDIAEVVNLGREIEDLKRRGFWSICADGNTDDNLYNRNFAGDKIVVVMGAEGRGVRQGIMNKCDFIISIPMKGKISSYNVSSAAAIIISEIMRQKM